MFYHVVIETKPVGKEKSESYFAYDIEIQNDIVNKYCIPYTSGNDFFIDGYNVNRKGIKRFYIAETESNVDSIIEQFNNNSINSGIISFITREMIVNDPSYSKDMVLAPKNEAKQDEFCTDKVFIVHGRDNGLKNEVARFIEHMGLEAIILHEQASSSLTVIEKLEKYTNVGFAIVLYTACDIGSLNDSIDYKPRARQNVVFEHGYLCAKLSRPRVCAIVEKEVELPSDLAGIVFIPHDISGSWKYQVAKEMKAAGINIDMNRI
jgi:predicted nucleotide-binding protein